MAKKSPMSLSLDYLNKSGWTCQIVEKWNAHARVRQDCFGFGDILAYQPRCVGDIALIQCTTADHFANRRTKILASPHYAGWKRAGARIFLHGWGDKGLREEEL